MKSLILILALIAAPAFATGNHETPPTLGGTNTNTNTSTNANTNVNVAGGGSATATGGKGGSATSNSGASAGASANDGDYFNVSLAQALVGCQTGAGAGGMGFGAQLGGESHGCQLLRGAAALQAMAASHREFPGMFYEAAVLEREAAAMTRLAVQELSGGTAADAPILARGARWLYSNVVRPPLSIIPVLRNAL